MSFFGGDFPDTFDMAFALFAAEEMQEEEKENALFNAGLDELDLALMDDDERNTALLDAGLDPDDYEW